jgi:hypothetical protein
MVKARPTSSDRRVEILKFFTGLSSALPDAVLPVSEGPGNLLKSSKIAIINF